MKNNLKYTFTFVCSFFIYCSLIGQTYPDHFGTGNDVGISTTSSPSISNNDAGQNMLNGTGYQVDSIGAARFLAQATLGVNIDDIDTLTQITIEEWIDWQVNMPYTSFYDHHREITDTIKQNFVSQLAFPSTKLIERRGEYITFTFYDKVFKHNDKLRQKIAFALSQIFVINRKGELFTRSFGVADYYDIFYNGAFGNFRDMIDEVAYHATMGVFLSHLENAKADGQGSEADENFARELMQLFTIGLYELNNDGSLKLDECGNAIPTYNINDVQEMAKIFTGLQAGAKDSLKFPGSTSYSSFTLSKHNRDYTVRMKIYEDEHDTTAKSLFNGDLQIDSLQTGDEDIAQALDYLFNHSNVGPFIALRLIQQLVKSNPSPAYINRVAMVFNNNGFNVRGDMEAVIRAILIDPEARDCDFINTPKAGKLLQPIERLTHLLSALDVSTPSGNFWLEDYSVHIQPKTQQSFLAAPSVFNFFSPLYQHDSTIVNSNMYSPEFEILNSTTVLQYVNLLSKFLRDDQLFFNYTKVDTMSTGHKRAVNNTNDRAELDYQLLVEILDDYGIESLLNYLDLILCRGQLSEHSKHVIANTINDYSTLSFNQSNTINNPNKQEELIREAIYFIMLSPEFLILN